MFGRNYMNGNVKWLSVTDFLSNDGPTWTLNFMAPYDIGRDRGSITNPNWVNKSWGDPGSVSIPWNCPVLVFLVYRHMILEYTRATARRVRDDILQGNHMVRTKSPSTCHNPIQNWRVNWRDYYRDGPVDQ